MCALPGGGTVRACKGCVVVPVLRSSRVRRLSSPHFRDSARIRTFAAILLAALIFAPQQISAGQSSSDIGDATLEDLMNMQVTSASRREQRAADVSAAVFVITAEEIRASGVTLVPELLRLSPGGRVARTWVLVSDDDSIERILDEAVKRGATELWRNHYWAEFNGFCGAFRDPWGNELVLWVKGGNDPQIPEGWTNE